MHEHAVAAEVVACLASEPGRVQAIDALAARCGRSVADVAAACAFLERSALLDAAVSGGVRLPVTRRPPARPLVLVVENTDAVAHLVGALLESEGYQVLIAGSLELGKQVVVAVPVDLVIADSFAGTAREAPGRLAEIRDAAGPVPVMIFTAHRDLEQEDAVAAGYAGILPKPFDIDDLLARVAAVITERRSAG